MIVVCIDGPARGFLRDSPDGYRWFIVRTAPPDYIGPYDTVVIQETTYYIHQFAFLELIIFVASVHLLPEEIDQYDAAECLLSENARQSSRRQ